VTSRTFLLAAHITSVAAWLGANFIQILLSPRFARESGDAAAAWARQQLFLGRRYYNLVGALIGVTGVLLVLDGDWSWSSGFIWVGIGVVIAGGAMGGLVFNPLASKRVEALDSGDTATADRLLRRIMPFALLDTILVLLALLAMVHKWQAG
jgi:hypothetical protein